MRLSLPACLFVLSWSLFASSCADDASGRTARAFDSPYGDPGGSAVCRELEYLVGAQCVSRSPLDASPPPDSSADAATNDAGSRTPGPVPLDASSVLGASS